MNEPSKKGCGWGCGLGCLVFVVGMVILLAVAFVGGKKWLEGKIPTEGVALQKPVLTQETADRAILRLNQFLVALESGSAAAPLELSSDEVNALIQHHEAFQGAADSIVVSMDGDQLNGEFSLSFDSLDLPESALTPFLAGRYLNGDATMTLKTVGGTHGVYVTGLSIQGWDLPASFMEGFGQGNLLGDFVKTPEAAALFDKIEEVAVSDGRLIITPAAPTANP